MQRAKGKRQKAKAKAKYKKCNYLAKAKVFINGNADSADKTQIRRFFTLFF